MSISNNLYPPIVNTYMPAFIQNQSCRVYFSLSDFNKYEDVKNNVQVMINDKNTNQSVLNSTLYPAGIKITSLNEDKNISSNMRYYIDILPSELREAEFKTNRFYKVQIRFTSSAVAIYNPETDKIAKWLVDNQSMFSEWSSVCLVRGIKQPIVTIRGFEENVQNKEIIFTSETIQLVGNVQFENPSGEMAEFLDSVQVKLFKKELGEDSGKNHSVEIFQDTTAFKSEFKYVFKEAIEDGVSYVIKFTYVTNGGYQESKNYTFKVIQYGIDKINANIFATADDAEGRIKVEVKALETVKEDFIGKITIRRTSSESNFAEWEDVHNVLLTEAKELDYTWYDYTIKSGVWYKYCVQKRNRRNDRGVIVATKEPVMAYFEDVFLTHGGRQLKLKFDSTVSSFKYNVLESKIDTLGSQYPFIRRNGHAKYRTFPITGLITSFCDEAGLFTTKQDIYGNTLSLYEKYNDDNDINEYRDFSYEREFREKVMDFLYENNIKLFKSPTEGNILVRLMDINLTPNQTLGRMLYSFSATAYEMDKADIDNYNNYDIQIKDELSEGLIQQKEDRLGKVIITGGYRSYNNSFSVRDTFSNFSSETIYCPNDNIVELIGILNANKSSIGFDNKVRKLKQLKIIFTSKPYLIKEYNGQLEVLKSTSTIEDDAIVVYGYWIKVNNQDILIKANTQYSKKREVVGTDDNGFADLIRTEYATYEINDLDITSLQVKESVDIELDFIAENIQTESITNLVNKVYYNKKIGQLENIFKPGHSVIKDLKLKYTEEYDRGYEELVAVNGISIEAPQGTLVTMKDSLDDRYNQHEISDTNFLDFENLSTTIDELYFNGMRLSKAPYQENYPELIRDRTDFLYKYPYVNDDKYNRIKDIEYVNQYYSYSVVNEKIVVERQYIHEFPKFPIKNGVYLQSILIGEDEEGNKTFEYKYWIYYQNNWYIFDPVEELVLCPIDALVNYYCEVVEGEYD